MKNLTFQTVGVSQTLILCCRCVSAASSGASCVSRERGLLDEHMFELEFASPGTHTFQQSTPGKRMVCVASHLDLPPGSQSEIAA